MVIRLERIMVLAVPGGVDGDDEASADAVLAGHGAGGGGVGLGARRFVALATSGKGGHDEEGHEGG